MKLPNHVPSSCSRARLTAGCDLLTKKDEDSRRPPRRPRPASRSTRFAGTWSSVTAVHAGDRAAAT